MSNLLLLCKNPRSHKPGVFAMGTSWITQACSAASPPRAWAGLEPGAASGHGHPQPDAGQFQRWRPPRAIRLRPFCGRRRRCWRPGRISSTSAARARGRAPCPCAPDGGAGAHPPRDPCSGGSAAPSSPSIPAMQRPWRAALDAGARIVNDVTALSHDPAARRWSRPGGRRLCSCICAARRQTMNSLNPMAISGREVAAELAAQIAAALADGHQARRRLRSIRASASPRSACRMSALLQDLGPLRASRLPDAGRTFAKGLHRPAFRRADSGQTPWRVIGGGALRADPGGGHPARA